jgi:hypothetical protein
VVRSIIDWAAYHAVVDFEMVVECVILALLQGTAIHWSFKIVLRSNHVRLILFIVL